MFVIIVLVDSDDDLQLSYLVLQLLSLVIEKCPSMMPAVHSGKIYIYTGKEMC